MDHKPFAVDLLVNIRDPNREIQWLAILILTSGSENTVPVSEIPSGFRFPVAHFSVNRVGCKEAFPVLSKRCGTRFP